MLRDTMIMTMPVARMATAELWTDRFHRFRGVRKVPPDMMSKPTQMTASAPTMPSMRVSTSRDASTDPSVRRAGTGLFTVGDASVTASPPWWDQGD